MIELKRFTTEYEPAEDRLRLTGADGGGQVVVLWLTQRLLNRLVVHLCQSLEGRSEKPKTPSRMQSLETYLKQSFAQQKAYAMLTAQRQVRSLSASPDWLVRVTDVKCSADSVRLVFKGETDENRAVINLSTPALRQWLGIVSAQYRRADWATQVWPAWMEERPESASKPDTVVLH